MSPNNEIYFGSNFSIRINNILSDCMKSKSIKQSAYHRRHASSIVSGSFSHLVSGRRKMIDAQRSPMPPNTRNGKDGIICA